MKRSDTKCVILSEVFITVFNCYKYAVEWIPKHSGIVRQRELFKMYDKKQKIEQRTFQYNQARKDIAALVGFRQPSEYTIDDLKKFITEKYGAVESNYPDCMDYLFYRIPESQTPIGVLTEGYVLDNECRGIYVLPALCPQEKPTAKKNGALLIINAENCRLDSWWGGGNSKGYEALKMELQIFSGKSLEDILKIYK